MKYLILLILVTTITGCVSKSNYDDIKSEKDNLEVELASIKSENEMLKQELSEINDELNSLKLNYNIVLENKKQSEAEKGKVRYYSETEALEFLKDYYDFYHTDYSYRNVETRRVNNNTFIFSLEENWSVSKLWFTKFYDLWINNDGTYQMQPRLK